MLKIPLYSIILQYNNSLSSLPLFDFFFQILVKSNLKYNKIISYLTVNVLTKNELRDFFLKTFIYNRFNEYFKIYQDNILV